MSVELLVPENADYFRDRINQLSPDSQRIFGTLTVVEMMRHMRNAVETSLGETDLPDESKPIIGSLLYFTITHLMTRWPGGKLKAPDYWTPPAEQEFDEERESLIAALDRFMKSYDPNSSAKEAHPMLGPLTFRQWARLNGIHFQHHFRQFGVN